MRSAIWFYLFLGLFFTLLVYLAYITLPEENNIHYAFYHFETRAKTTNYQISRITDESINQIEPILKKKPKLRYPLLEGINEIRVLSHDFSYEKIYNLKIALTAASLLKDKSIISNEELLARIIKNSSVDSIVFSEKTTSRFDDYGDIPISKDATWPTYLLIELGYGDELERAIMETRQKMIDHYERTLHACQKEAYMTTDELNAKKQSIRKNLPLQIDTTWHYRSDNFTWAEANFEHFPYAACMNSLEQHSLNAKISENILVQDLLSLVDRD